MQRQVFVRLLLLPAASLECHVEVMFVQLLNLLERYYVYLVIKSYKLLISCCIYKVMFVQLLELLKIRCLFRLPI